MGAVSISTTTLIAEALLLIDVVVWQTGLNFSTRPRRDKHTSAWNFHLFTYLSWFPSCCESVFRFSSWKPNHSLTADGKRSAGFLTFHRRCWLLAHNSPEWLANTFCWMLTCSRKPARWDDSSGRSAQFYLLHAVLFEQMDASLRREAPSAL